MNKYKKLFFLLSMIILPLSCFAQEQDNSFHLGAEIFNYIDYALVITSLICIKQFFWPGEGDAKTVFHIFNIIFIIIFYLLSLSFLVANKQFYEGYESLSPLGCIFKVFFSFDFYSILQLIVLFAFVINILYIIKFRDGFSYNEK